MALARALIIEPDVLLMDEPLGALDKQLRRPVQLELRRLHEEHRRTTIYVTHDQEEALVLSDRVAVMRDGRIEQIGGADDLYDCPVNAFVAGFIGESNLLPAKIVAIAAASAQVDVPAFGRTADRHGRARPATGRDGRSADSPRARPDRSRSADGVAGGNC